MSDLLNMNRIRALTTARWHCLNTAMPWSREVNDAVLAALSDRLGFPAPGADRSIEIVPIAPLPPMDAPVMIGLFRGHGRPVDEGNVGAGGVSEEDYNGPLIEMVSARLSKRGVPNFKVMDYPPHGYEAAMMWVADYAKQAGATAALEFHFNAYDGTKRGHEVLHWASSLRGKPFAAHISASLDRQFPWHPARGLKPKSSHDRGALFLSLTHCPAAILEPFFGDERADWEHFSSDEGMADLADAITDGICDWIDSLEVRP